MIFSLTMNVLQHLSEEGENQEEGDIVMANNPYIAGTQPQRSDRNQTDLLRRELCGLHHQQSPWCGCQRQNSG